MTNTVTLWTVVPPGSTTGWHGEAPMDTVAAPYSGARFQPMIHATRSPTVAYAYVYALPATGIMVENATQAGDERDRRTQGLAANSFITAGYHTVEIRGLAP